MSWDECRVEKYDELEWVKNDDVLSTLRDMCHVLPTDTIVDFGTGTGVVAKMLAPDCKKVIGVDISSKMIAKAPKIENVEYVVADGEISVPSGNGLVARMSFHHLNDYRLFIRRNQAFDWIVICEGIPPLGCGRWYTEMFALKEQRTTMYPDDMVNALVDAGYKDVQIKTAETVASINNWLSSSGLSKSVCEKIYSMHKDAPGYVWDAYDMLEYDDDLVMTWQTAIIRGDR